ncbi:hypothetical protein MXD63_07610 [Frankia sp. Cpl3]|nr:hypothetical protein [Parafrankia colletiae]MCK9899942.1 hypothetical protein [Frankia sp. Cpl3]
MADLPDEAVARVYLEQRRQPVRRLPDGGVDGVQFGDPASSTTARTG